MTLNEARGVASLILGLVGAAVKFTRSDRKLIIPTDSEIDGFAEALIETLYRRANPTGAVGDIFAVLFTLGRYSMRAINAPSSTPAAAVPS
jgi:hypothetical protein